MPHDTLPTLGRQLLDQLRKHNDGGVELPSQPMADAPETILQIGWGKFLRGFTPDFVQLANQNGQYSGRIIAVQRRPDHRSEAFARQDGLYTVIQRGSEHGQTREVKRIIGAVSRLLVAERDWDKVVQAMTNLDLRVIVTNATETGLAFDPGDRGDRRPPHSFAGKLTQLLFERWSAIGGWGADIAIVPTELVANNGQLIHERLLEQARAWKLGAAFLDWMKNAVHVADTLVDRIVVGTPRAQLLAEECQSLGYHDDLLTSGEPFYLFAIVGDEFIRRNFPLDRALPNVRFVDDLAPYRRRKLRLLNGPHMVLATLGSLVDLRTVRDALNDSQVGPFTGQSVWQEIIPAMGSKEVAVNSEYARECLDRIGNPQIEHLLGGIRVDLTTKNSIRLFPSICDFIAQTAGLPSRLLLTLAATLEVAIGGGLQDSHAGYIQGRWAALAKPPRESVLIFVQEALAHLSTQTREPLEVDRVAPHVRDLLQEIRENGLREVLGRRYCA